MAAAIRELRAGDLDAFAELCAARDGLDRAAAERRAEIVEWMAFANPARDDRPTYLVAADGPRLLGHLGRMPALFQIGRARRLGSFIHDLFVHPELRARGRGFFTAMQLYRAAEFACPSFAVLVWSNEINIGLQRARGYEPLWVGGRAKALALDARIDRIGFAPLAAAGKLAARVALRAADRAIAMAGRTRRNVEAFELFDGRFDRLADRLVGRIGASPVKSRRYLTWKYGGWPHLRWAGFAAHAGGELLGFAVVVAGSSGTATIAELVADPDDAATIAALVQGAIERCRAAGIARIDAIATDPRFARVLARHLFLERSPRLPLFLANAPALLRRPDRWHLSYGDSEGAL